MFHFVEVTEMSNYSTKMEDETKRYAMLKIYCMYIHNCQKCMKLVMKTVMSYFNLHIILVIDFQMLSNLVA